MTTFAPDTQFGKYRILRLLGQGGMADVYEAEDTTIGRKVALKILPLAFARDEERAKRFAKEIQACAQLDHPNIVSVFDVGEVDHLHYYTMSVLPGGDLKDRLKQGALKPEIAVCITQEIASALNYAHEKGFVHRDVKPENILFRENDSAVLTDFGIARATTGGTRMTATGLSIGTPHYMSPEQARGHDLDGRSDLYALGVVFFEMLSGEAPYDAQDSFAVGLQHINDPVPQLPATLGNYQPLIDRLLAKNPDDRYQTGAELIEDLERIEQGEKLKPARSATRVVKKMDRGSRIADRGESTERDSRPGLYWGLGGAALAGVLAIGIYVWQDHSSSPAPIGGGLTTVSGPASGSDEPVDPERAGSEAGTRQRETESSPDEGLAEEIGVALIQDYLNRLGYQVPRSGEFDGRTAAGIRAFEESRDLLVTGEIDEMLKTALMDAYRELDEADWREAREADTEQAYRGYAEAHPDGHAIEQVPERIEALRERQFAEERQPELVSDIQAELRRLGRTLSVDGEFGPATAAHIRAFEQASERPQRGEASDQLLAALRSADRWPGPQPGDTFQDCSDCPEMVVIPAGRFTMGSPSNEPQRRDNEGPQRQVNVRAFALGKYAVTFAQWDACVADGGCSHQPGDQGWGRGARPVINVNWNDAQEYVQWLSRKTGEEYRLASEAEWEYAARAGTTTRFNTGDCITTDQVNFRGTKPAQGCPRGEYRQRTVPVGSFAPNAFGLYDMHGNVREAVQDCWNDSYRGAPTDGSAWGGNCDRAVLRGGSWVNSGQFVRSAVRFGVYRVNRGDSRGFRVARSVSL